MKKVLAFLLACLMLVSLAACGGGGGGEKPAPEPEEKVLHMRLSKSLASTDWATARAALS